MVNTETDVMMTGFIDKLQVTISKHWHPYAEFTFRDKESAVDFLFLLNESIERVWPSE